nr:hypothetical protein [Tanacetum cinerariifolium]
CLGHLDVVMHFVENGIGHTFEPNVCDLHRMLEMCLCDVDRMAAMVEARIIPCPVGILQKALARKKVNVQARGRDNILTTQEYVRKVNEDVSEDDHFMQGPWLQALVYLHGDMTVTLEDPTGTMGGTIHYKLFKNEDDGSAKSIKVGSVLILRNVYV